MGEANGRLEKRGLAGIEADLLKAEEAFADADARFKEAEQDRRAALETINLHQREMDEAFAELRKLSIPGTRWRSEQAGGEEPLELHSEDIVTDGRRVTAGEASLTSEATKKAFAKDFELLKASAKARNDDPVLKVVASPKG